MPLSKPFVFDYQVTDPEDQEGFWVRISVEPNGFIEVTESNGDGLYFFSLPEADQMRIRDKIETHLFMLDAAKAWASE